MPRAPRVSRQVPSLSDPSRAASVSPPLGAARSGKPLGAPASLSVVEQHAFGVHPVDPLQRIHRVHGLRSRAAAVFRFALHPAAALRLARLAEPSDRAIRGTQVVPIVRTRSYATRARGCLRSVILSRARSFAAPRPTSPSPWSRRSWSGLDQPQRVAAVPWLHPKPSNFAQDSGPAAGCSAKSGTAAARLLSPWTAWIR